MKLKTLICMVVALLLVFSFTTAAFADGIGSKARGKLSGDEMPEVPDDVPSIGRTNDKPSHISNASPLEIVRPRYQKGFIPTPTPIRPPIVTE